ncbi:MAG: CpaF family protein [Chloroflexi bacterium]|nr:CpaF family protein [Chloroflexota bacterium]
MTSASEALLRQGIEALKQGRRGTARELLEKLVNDEPAHELGWLWLSGATDDHEEQIICLENVLTLNPQNERARKGLAALKAKRPDPPPPDAFGAAYDLPDFGEETPFGAVDDSDVESGFSDFEVSTPAEPPPIIPSWEARWQREQEHRQQLSDLQNRIMRALLYELEPNFEYRPDSAAVDERLRDLFNEILAEEYVVLTRTERERLYSATISELFGYGPLDPLLKDESITAIMVNGPKLIFIEQNGQKSLSGVVFEDDEHVHRIKDRIAAPLGRRIDEIVPFGDARLPDGSTAYLTVRPIALNGPSMTIRKYRRTPFTVEDLLSYNSATPEICTYLQMCATAGMSILVTGGLGAGKTTLCNIMAAFIPANRRLITLETIAELQAQHEHVVTLECSPLQSDGQRAVNTLDLIEQARLLRADAVLFGPHMNQGGGERLFVLPKDPPAQQIMGSLDGGDARDAITRLEIIGLQSDDGPLEVLRQRIAERLQVIVHMRQLHDGSRKIAGIWEVTGLSGGEISLSLMFDFQPTGMVNGKVYGEHRIVTTKSQFIDHFVRAGMTLPPFLQGSPGKPRSK